MIGERQIHGFNFEKYIIEKYHIEKTENYTDKWDGYLNNIPVSIKLEKLNSDIELADFRRNALNEENFYLIVGFWEGSKDNIVKIEFLFIQGDQWHQLFPTHFIEDFDNMLNNITNDKKDDKKWREMMQEQKARWKNETSNYIRPRFKRDHKTQKRIQCAINYKDFYTYFVPKYRIEEEKLYA